MCGKSLKLMDFAWSSRSGILPVNKNIRPSHEITIGIPMVLWYPLVLTQGIHSCQSVYSCWFRILDWWLDQRDQRRNRNYARGNQERSGKWKISVFLGSFRLCQKELHALYGMQCKKRWFSWGSFQCDRQDGQGKIHRQEIIRRGGRNKPFRFDRATPVPLKMLQSNVISSYWIFCLDDRFNSKSMISWQKINSFFLLFGDWWVVGAKFD